MTTEDKNTRILTGDRPTGPLHLGHYAGSLRERLRYQSQGAECFFIIADYQVMTDRLETADVEKYIVEVAMDYFAVGIDPLKSVVFIQSKIPELAELTTFLSMLVSMAEVGRNPTVKEEVRRMGQENTMSLGMFSYPVSQAADILLFRPNIVPVGEDQLPHIELTREIARKFNRLYGNTFPLPEGLVSHVPKLLGLDGSEKMSKSRGNAIYLNDDPDTIRKKVKDAKTDTGREVRFDPENKPAISNLMRMYQVATGHDIPAIQEEFEGKGYGAFKDRLTQALVHVLGRIQIKRRIYQSDPGVVHSFLRNGTAKAREEASQTMSLVREALHYDFPQIFKKT